MNKGFGLVGILIGVVIIIGIAYGGFYYSGTTTQVIDDNGGIENIINKAEDVKDKLEENNEEISDNLIDTTNWETYHNKEFGFELKIPTYLHTMDINNRWFAIRVVSNRIKSVDDVIFAEMDIIIKEDKLTPLNKYRYSNNYEDFQYSSKSTLGGKEALVFEVPNGSYDINLGYISPFVVYSTKNGDDFFNLIFIGNTTLNQTQNAILSSFKFID